MRLLKSSLLTRLFHSLGIPFLICSIRLHIPLSRSR
nr:MAG TPA: hypothetical protein [Caudoviricetes sp.]DAS52202.1 MAG TPA: hypothetical protein [Caudoviricetes sp.]DAS61487.1 MAG TPA: hypothetical protein [Caudoviricetes sp.]